MQCLFQNLFALAGAVGLSGPGRLLNLKLLWLGPQSRSSERHYTFHLLPSILLWSLFNDRFALSALEGLPSSLSQARATCRS